ncbi:rna-directed dna polymerase from mobile element jockey-like [Pitangus sulphuratus]|nr:rna-directed dna polymerase from mobile element jockey-like [Pitangus sulphuratus]
MNSTQRPVNRGVPQASIWGPILCQIFMNDLDDGTGAQAKLGAGADAPKGTVAIQRDLDRRDKGADRNLMQFNKGKGKVLHLERNIPRPQHKLGAAQLRNSLQEKALGVLVDTKLNVIWSHKEIRLVKQDAFPKHMLAEPDPLMCHVMALKMICSMSFTDTEVRLTGL